MRMLMKVRVPVSGGNRGIVDGSLPSTILTFVDQMKPEASYFTAEHGERCLLFIFDLQDSSQLPGLCESFFQGFDAAIEIAPVMNLDELRKGLAQVPKRDGGKTEATRPAAQARPR